MTANHDELLNKIAAEAGISKALLYHYYPDKVAVLFEYEVDAEGNTHSEYWEWK